MSNPIQQTIIFGVAFFAILFLTLHRKKGNELFPVETTNELKGLSILLIILSHIGYFLVNDSKFLSPFSHFAGVAVDIFLFLSGFGLAISSFTKELSRKEFYKKRLGKIFVPLWFVLFVFLSVDYFFLHKTYPFQDILENFLGIFRHADIYEDIDSPLWYITLTLFYYLLFPFFFSKKKPIFSAIGLFCAAWLLLQLQLPVTASVLSLYNLHFIAFPLGVVCAALFKKYKSVLCSLVDSFLFRIAIISSLLAIFVLCVFQSAVGKTPLFEQDISIVMTLCIVGIFLFKKIQFRILSILGLYSYEIYLFHWPLLYRYDFLYRHFSAGIATILSVFIFVSIGFCIFSFKRLINVSKISK